MKAHTRLSENASEFQANSRLLVISVNFGKFPGFFGRMEHSVLVIKSRLTSFPDLLCRAEHASNKDGGLKRDKASQF